MHGRHLEDHSRNLRVVPWFLTVEHIFSKKNTTQKTQKEHHHPFTFFKLFHMASTNSSDELSLADKGVGITTCVDSLQSFVKTNGRRPTTLTLTKNHAIGVDGMVTLAESWLAPSTKSESDEGNSIEILNIASCR
jgi:hypothetical protein